MTELANNVRKFMFSRSLLAVSFAVVLSGSAAAQVSGTLETYYQSTSRTRGLQNYLSWLEVNANLASNLRTTVSYITSSFGNAYDEAFVAYDQGPNSVQVGRFRTAFGFGDWSDAFYNGFNHLPLMRTNPLANRLALERDDTGAEITIGSDKWQVQAAAVDTRPGTDQFAPTKVRASTLRIQHPEGNFILGFDYLQGVSDHEGVAGVDLRWSAPHLLVRGEAMRGFTGGKLGTGFYGDVTYRLPGYERTQLVGRVENYSNDRQGEFWVETVGLRQVLLANLTVNLNYGTATSSGQKTPYGSFLPIYQSGVEGWSLRAMLQIHF